MLFRRANTPDVHFLAEQQPSLHDNDFFNDRHDRKIAFVANGRHDVDVLPDWHVLDLDAFVGEFLLDQMVAALRHRRDANNRLLDFAARDRDIFGIQRDDQFLSLRRKLIGRCLHLGLLHRLIGRAGYGFNPLVRGAPGP